MSFEEIRGRAGLVDSQVIEITRRALKTSGFRCWGKVSAVEPPNAANSPFQVQSLNPLNAGQRIRGIFAERVAPVAA
jgi:hypothetical protein